MLRYPDDLYPIKPRVYPADDVASIGTADGSGCSAIVPEVAVVILMEQKLLRQAVSMSDSQNSNKAGVA